MPTITKTVSVETEVDVDIDIHEDDIMGCLNDDDLIDEIESRGYEVIECVDAARHESVLRRALAFVRTMPNRPRELEDFFYEVHGEAM